MQGFAKRRWAELADPQKAKRAIRATEVAESRSVAMGAMASAGAIQGGQGRQIPADFAEQTSYRSASLIHYRVPQALVHSAAGLIAVAPYLVLETLNHTHGGRDFYDDRHDGIALTPQAIRTLPGTAFSMLCGNYEIYYHWMLDGVARLACLRELMERKDGPLLVPTLGHGFRRQTMDLLNWIAPDRLIEVGPSDAILVERLIVPGTAAGAGWSVHPAINAIFDDITAGNLLHGPHRKRIYVSRVKAENRRMINELELIAALAPFGVQAVTLESMPVAEQIRLFSGAELIVGPHGGGLTNLLFASGNCRIVELFDARYVNWCYRVIAASRSLAYDAVICPQPADAAGRSWTADMDATTNAVRAALVSR